MNKTQAAAKKAKHDGSWHTAACECYDENRAYSSLPSRVVQHRWIDAQAFA